MFGPRTTLFKIFDFEVKVDMSWVFIALLIAWSLANGYFPTLYEGLPVSTYWWMGIVGAIGLFSSIVFHELAHSLVARRYGIPIKGITLFIFGGIAEMEEEPKSARAEFMMAIAGPLASLFLSACFYLLVSLGSGLGIPPALHGVLSYLAFFNGIIALFNMVPAFPLDGGRVFRSALWHWTGNYKWATRIASNTGVTFGLLLMALGVFNMVSGNFLTGLWWILIGMFVRNAAAANFVQMRIKNTLEGKRIADFMTPDPITVSPDLTVRDLVENYVYRYHHKLFPVIELKQLIGCISTAQIKDLPRDQWEQTSVGQIMHTCSPNNTIDADQDAMKALDHIRRTKSGRFIVTKNGALVGIIALKDMLELFSLQMDLEDKS